MTGELFTLSETMELLGCSLPKVWRLIDAGDLEAFDTAPSTSSRRCIMVSSDSLSRFKLARRVSGTGVDANGHKRPARRKILRSRSALGRFVAAIATSEPEAT